MQSDSLQTLWEPVWSVRAGDYVGHVGVDFIAAMPESKAQTGPQAHNDLDDDRGRQGRLRENAEMARAGAALRECAARLPLESRIGRELAAWGFRLQLAAKVHAVLDSPDEEDRASD